MKKIFSTLTLLLFLSISHAQIEEGLLFGLTNGTTTEISNINTSSITEGTLVYDTDKKKVMGYINSQWKEIMTSTVTATVSSKTASYTLVNDDNGSILTFNSNSDMTLTVPSGLSIGYHISIYQIGTGKVTIVGSGGVAIKNRLSRFKTAGKDSGVGIICTATNTFHATGDLKK